MIELLVRQIYSVGLIAFLIVFLSPVTNRLFQFLIIKVGSWLGGAIYISLCCLLFLIWSLPFPHKFFAKQFIEQNGYFDTDIVFGTRILSEPALRNDQEAQLLKAQLLLLSESAQDRYSASTILARLMDKGNAEAAYKLAYAFLQDKIRSVEFDNKFDAAFYCFEVAKCLGKTVEDYELSSIKLLGGLSMIDKAKSHCTKIQTGQKP